MSATLHVERGGSGDPLLVLLHGMGANAEVWWPMLATAGARWPGRWLAPDLRGHGRSPKDGPFDAPTFAGDIADLISREKTADVTLLGHSFGGLVAALVGTNDLGVTVSRVVAFGVKTDWSDEEVARMHALATRPASDFATYEEAAARALAFAGLKGLAALDSSVARAGVLPRGEKFGLAFNIEVFGSTGNTVAESMRACRVTLRLASGEQDTMAPIDHLRRLDPTATLIPGAGHNAHWEVPGRVWDLLGDL